MKGGGDEQLCCEVRAKEGSHMEFGRKKGKLEYAMREGGENGEGLKKGNLIETGGVRSTNFFNLPIRATLGNEKGKKKTQDY